MVAVPHALVLHYSFVFICLFAWFMYAELMCPELKIANSRKITYSNPKREEGSKASYSCNPGFKKGGNKKTRTCKNGKFEGAPQLCVGELCGAKQAPQRVEGAAAV